MIFKKTKRVVIAGSGPSLAHISYDRLPHDAKIWRANNFFMEPKYFLGRNVDAIFNGGAVNDILTRIQKFYDIHSRGEYNINLQNIYIDKPIPELKHLKQHFDTIEYLSAAQNAPELGSMMKYNAEIWDMHLFSGVAAIIVAILSGFNEIYLTGIDCDYETGPRYVYSSESAQPILEWVHAYHPTQFQWDTIKKYQDKFNVKIFSLSPTSPAAEIFPMAPRIKNRHNCIPYTPQDKNTNNENI